MTAAQKIAMTSPATMPKTIFSAMTATASRTIQATTRRASVPKRGGLGVLHAAKCYPRALNVR